jgi:hypothetical protein
MSKPRMSLQKRQREQSKRDRQRLKAERRGQRSAEAQSPLEPQHALPTEAAPEEPNSDPSGNT